MHESEHSPFFSLNGLSCVISYKKLHNEKFLHTKPFASALFCALAYRPNITWAAEPTLLLVLQSTVDQLGGDLPGRFIKLMGEGGIRYLIDNGVWYADAYGHPLWATRTPRTLPR